MAFFWWWLYISVTPSVKVPNLVGLGIEEARARAGNAKFALHETWRNADEPQGTVLRQDPEADITVKNRSLKVWISRGPEEIEVPDLLGRAPDEARTTLEDLGLVYAEGESQRSETINEGLVAGQTPGPGTQIARGGTVRVNLSVGNKFLIEDFRGRTASEAEARLNELEVAYDEVWVPSDLREGVVVDQIPAPGELNRLGRSFT